jgi:hypothetical protein
MAIIPVDMSIFPIRKIMLELSICCSFPKLTYREVGDGLTADRRPD